MVVGARIVVEAVEVEQPETEAAPEAEPEAEAAAECEATVAAVASMAEDTEEAALAIEAAVPDGWWGWRDFPAEDGADFTVIEAKAVGSLPRLT